MPRSPSTFVVACAALCVVACTDGAAPASPRAPAATMSCPGPYAESKSADGIYGVVSFGCFTDENGETRGGHPLDTCVPGCFAEARNRDLCDPLRSGKLCEERVTWFVAGAGRFGCLTRVRVKNVASSTAVIAVVLDYGPNCALERRAAHPLLAASGRVVAQLFGSSDRPLASERVEVTEVDPSTPLGPEP